MGLKFLYRNRQYQYIQQGREGDVPTCQHPHQAAHKAYHTIAWFLDFVDM